MGLLKAIFLGLLAAIGIATVAHGTAGTFGDAARWHSLYFPIGPVHLYLSLPIFIGVTLFSWAFFFWARE